MRVVIEELRDPWSVVVAVAAGLTVAWFTPPSVALGVVLAILAVRVAVGRAGRPPAKPVTDADFDGGPGGRLTPRELEVAELVAEHLTNKEIGARLVITPKGVASHIDHIFGKLDIHRRSELVAWWQRRKAYLEEKTSPTRPAR